MISCENKFKFKFKESILQRYSSIRCSTASIKYTFRISGEISTQDVNYTVANRAEHVRYQFFFKCVKKSQISHRTL